MALHGHDPTFVLFIDTPATPAALILHIGPLVDPPGIEAGSLLSQLPIPRFNSDWWINAILSGLIGGWLGLQFIVGLVAGLISSLAPLFRQGEG